MNHVFRKLSLPAKLTMLAALPLLFLLVLVIQFNQEKNAKLEMIDSYRLRIVQAININDLIDKLQYERRLSFVYVMKGLQQNDMLRQRMVTDEAIAAVEKVDSKMSGNIASYTFLNDLKNVRAQIDRAELQPLDVLNFFTSSIFRLNTLNAVSAGNISYLQPVMKTVTGQKILSDIITYKGIVVAQLYYLLETKQQIPQLVTSINQLQSIIATYVREYRLKAPPERINELNAFRNDPNVRIADSVENDVQVTVRVDTAVGAEYYWAAATNTLNKYKVLQDTMMEEGRAGAEAIYEDERWQQILSLALVIAMLILVTGFIIFTIRVITQRLKELQHAAEKLSVGETGLRIEPETNDALGSLALSILAIDENNRLLATAAKAIGDGDFAVALQPRSSADVLGNALVHMKQDLQTYARESEAKIWSQTGIALLNDSLRGEKGLAQLGKDVLHTLVPYLGCESGLFYSENNGRLHFAAGYAVSDISAVPKEVSFGETLLGQAAYAHEPFVLEDVPDGFLQIRSGLGFAQPAQVLLIPLLANDIVEGVIEISSFRPLPAYTLAFVREAATDIALTLRMAKSKQQLQSLFEQRQAQAEELQAQHAELENINAELEAQAEKLQASEEELKVQQEELMQTNQELEERTRQLEERNALIVERNREIQQKAGELEISTKYKSEFLANMSHELRTPLNSILLLSRLLTENNENNLTSDQVSYATVIQTSGQGLLSLIDEILDLSKIEAGKMELEYNLVTVEEIAGGMKALFLPLTKEKGIALDIAIDPAVPATFETDKMRLEQVLRNLLSNAIKFTAQGSVSMAVSVLPDNKTFLAFTVKDTGIGIPKEKQALVFDAFKQADGSTRRKYGGTGLGLSISRELVRLMGGEIKLVSEPGKGSEFTVYLPMEKLVEVQPPVAAKEPVNEEPRPPLKEKTRHFRTEKIPASLPDDREAATGKDNVILIIEDDTVFAKALLDFAHTKGYKGLVAVRGDEGVALAQQFLPMGILLDIQLPVKDGWEVMEELKLNPATRHIPVHMMSSHEARRESLQKGAIDFISKPVAFEQMQDVFKKIEHVLTRENKKVLIVEENPQHAKALAYFLETFNVTAQIMPSVKDSVEALKKEEVNCVILDMGIPDRQAYDTLETVKQTPGMEDLPIIIFTGKSLSKTEESRIRQYADSIVVKTAHSYQRILDEVSLFLHLMEEGGKKEKPAGYKRLGALNEVLAGKKIMIADDDVRNIFSLTKALELHNVKVIAAMDGTEALARLEEHGNTLDAVLMDIMMPEMDGYEAMQAIRKMPEYRHLPIIAITAKAMTGDREKCIRAGASDYISKPVDIDQLLSLLRVWLYDKRL